MTRRILGRWGRVKCVGYRLDRRRRGGLGGIFLIIGPTNYFTTSSHHIYCDCGVFCCFLFSYFVPLKKHVIVHLYPKTRHLFVSWAQTEMYKKSIKSRRFVFAPFHICTNFAPSFLKRSDSRMYKGLVLKHIPGSNPSKNRHTTPPRPGSKGPRCACQFQVAKLVLQVDNEMLTEMIIGRPQCVLSLDPGEGNPPCPRA